jgi:hypothetical protein
MKGFTLAFAFISTALAAKPLCSVQGNSLQLPDGSWPHDVQDLGNIASQAACKDLCVNNDNCYSYAYHAGYKQCHFYDEIVAKIGFHSTNSGYLFSDTCCT